MRDFNRFDRRDRRSGSRDKNSRPLMFQAVCDECGKNCEVPFKPSGNKPVYCSDCFDRQGGNERDNREREMFSAICDECGKPCKLPFKPSSDKPVYCSDCFEMRGEKSGANKFKEQRNENPPKEIMEIIEQINSLNIKLDKIINALNLKPETSRKPKTVKVSKEKMAKVKADLELDEEVAE